VAAEAPASAAPSCRLNFSSYQTVKAGSRGVYAVAAECLLRSAGYRVVVNGYFSSTEAASVASFRHSKGLSATRVVDKSTWTALLARGSHPTLRRGYHGSDVARLQRALTASGRRVAITGTYGSQTSYWVKTIQRANGWYQSGTAGAGTWRMLQTGRAATLRIVAPSRPTTTTTNRGATALAFAKRQLGDSYRYGAAGPNAWDCSGLTMKAWASAGVSLPHSALAQFHGGKAVAKKDLRAGDLVFFYSGIRHVGIYAGSGKVLHASRPGKPVAYILMKYMPYQGARRPG